MRKNFNFIETLKVKNLEFFKNFQILNKFENFKTKLIVESKYGKHAILPQSLYYSDPTIQSAINKTEYFKNKAKEVHGDRYDYSLVKYEKARKKVKIICKIHGIFNKDPSCHISGKGCSICSFTNRGLKIRLTIEEFISRAKEVHGNKYNYELVDYKGKEIKVKIVCKEHGVFEQTPGNHLYNQGCPICGKIKSTLNRTHSFDKFRKKAEVLHNKKYKYTERDYIKQKVKISIECPMHGEFKQTPSAHLTGQGCPECGKDRLGFKNWVKNCKENYKKGKIYILRCYNDNEEFYKVGITVHSISKRYFRKELMPYNYEIILNNSIQCEKCFRYEIIFKKILNEYHYLPKIPFIGSVTECFKLKIMDKKIEEFKVALQQLKIKIENPLIVEIMYKAAIMINEDEPLVSKHMLKMYQALHKQEVEIKVDAIESALKEYKADKIELSGCVQAIIKNIKE